MIRYRFRTLQQSLFIYYSAVFIVFALIVAGLLYVFLANDIRSRSEEQQKQLGASLVSNLDQEVVKMNNFSMNIVYSNLVKEHFSHYLSPAEGSEQGLAADPAFYKDTTTLIDVILAIISSSNTAKQANIYDVNGKMLGAGAFNGQMNVDLTQRPWYNETWNRNGWRVITMLDGGSLPMPTGEGESDSRYVSLTRVYKNGNYVSQGVVEILQDAQTMFNYLHEIQAGNEELHIDVIDERGLLLYPFSRSSSEDVEATMMISSEDLAMIRTGQYPPGEMQEVVHTGNSPQMMTYMTSAETGWTVIVTQSKQSLFTNLNRMATLFIGATLGMLLLILVLSYLISKRVTLPLHRLQRIIQKIGVQDLATGQDSGHLFKLDHPSSIREMDELNDTFVLLNQQLMQSFQDMLALKSQETDTRLFALQSQMNPHFLYNNITNISIMAEEGMNDQIVAFCGHITAMLRYISAPNPEGVTLSEEMNYCERYLECMKIRFEEDLHYTFHIQEAMHHIRIPMLLIQPLLENTIKYGLGDSPPWKLYVGGELNEAEETWQIIVEDNGPGMEPEVLTSIQAYIASSEEWERIPELAINGMGLRNIWVRLKLWYGSRAQMHIENRPNGGVRITVVGLIRKERG